MTTEAGGADDSNALLETLLALPEAERRTALRRLNDDQRGEFATHWKLWARRSQLPPAGDWRTWLILAGRGFGKTRAGAEWVRALAEADPGARIALVAASLGEARAVMVEGESGLLAIAPPARRPTFEPSLRRLTWPGGAQATLYSAQEPESLRGPQHSHAFGPSPEGSAGERIADRRRCLAAWRFRSPDLGSAAGPGRWPGLDRGTGCLWRLGGQGWPDRLSPLGPVAVFSRSRRHAPVEPDGKAGLAV